MTLLASTVLMSLFGCGSDVKSAIVGKWNCNDGNFTLNLSENDDWTLFAKAGNSTTNGKFSIEKPSGWAARITGISSQPFNEHQFIQSLPKNSVYSSKNGLIFQKSTGMEFVKCLPTN